MNIIVCTVEWSYHSHIISADQGFSKVRFSSMYGHPVKENSSLTSSIYSTLALCNFTLNLINPVSWSNLTAISKLSLDANVVEKYICIDFV